LRYFILKPVDVSNKHFILYVRFSLFYLRLHLRLRLRLRLQLQLQLQLQPPFLVILVSIYNSLRTLRQLHNHSNNHHNAHHLPSLMHMLRPNHKLDRNFRSVHVYREAKLQCCSSWGRHDDGYGRDDCEDGTFANE
jgi:hypothetical protein